MNCFSDWVIFWGKMAFLMKKNFVMVHFKKGNNLGLLKLFGMSSSYTKTKEMLSLKEFFRLDHFWGRNSFFEKKLCSGWFWRRGWTRELKLGGMITYNWGSRLLSVFCENYGCFLKIGLYDFLKHCIWHCLAIIHTL